MGICMEYFMVQQHYCSRSCGRAPCSELPDDDRDTTPHHAATGRPEKHKYKSKTTAVSKSPPEDLDTYPPRELAVTPYPPPAEVPIPPAMPGDARTDTDVTVGDMEPSPVGSPASLPCLGDVIAARGDLNVFGQALVVSV